MIDRDEIIRAHARIQGRVRRTPILDLEAGALCASPVSLKLEAQQVTGSFKTRGAFNHLVANPAPPAGVATFSGGNHGAALAYAATALGAPSRVFTAEFVDPVKIDRMRGFGAEVDISADFEMADKRCAEFVEETGAVYVHPYDLPHILAGQGTVGREIDEDRPDIDTLFISVGGGGLIGGVTAWFEGRIRIVAVETEGTPTLGAAMKSGPETRISGTGIAASALGAPVIGKLAFEVLGWFPVEHMLVSDADVRAAQNRLWAATRLIGEPGAATALAPLVSGAYTPAPGERVAVLLCGSNAAPDWFLD